MRKPVFGVSDSKQAVQVQKMPRGLKFADLVRIGIVLSM